jgi:hypothetical protein
MTALATASSNCKPHKDYNRKSLVKKLLVLSLKGFGAKTNSLALNRQS